MDGSPRKFGPPRWAEAILEKLIPPACREHVVGDLHERYESPFQYMGDALFAGSMVILSRVRRTSDPVVRFMEAFVLYGSFVTVANAGGKLLTEQSSQPWGLLRLAIPPAITIVFLILADAYADPAKRAPLRPVFGVVLGLGGAFFCQGALSLAGSSLALPNLIMLSGAGFSLLLVSTLRMIFPPFADRPRGGNGPVFWQNQEIAGIDARLAKGLVMVGLVLALGAFAGGLPFHIPRALAQALIILGILLVGYQFWRQP